MLQHPHTHTGLQFEKTCPDPQTFTHTESRSSQESLQMRDVHIQAFTAHHLRSFDSACDQYICVQRLSHHLAPLCHFHPVGGMNLSPRKLEKIRVCLSVCIWGGLPVFRQSCYKHQKHQWAAFSEALQNPLAIMSPSSPPESLWKQWRHWSPIDCNDSHADRQEPAGQQLHPSPTAFNDSQRNWGTIVGVAMELTVSVQ